MLDELLKYHQEPEDDNFAREVLRKIRKPDHSRRWILWLSGAIGSLFGMTGVAMLSEPLAEITSALYQQAIWPVAAGTAGVILILTWLLNESIE